MKTKNKKWRIVLVSCGAVVALAGLVLALYSPIGMWLYQQKAHARIKEFENYTQQYTKEEEDWLYNLMVQYNKDLYENNQQGLMDPFSWEQVDFSLLEYGYEEELIGHVEIPAIDIDLPVYLGAGRENLNKGAGHLTFTSLPVGGENTNTVIVAHRGMPTAAMLRDINKLQVGDALYFTNFRETMAYKVVEYEIILPHEVEKVMIQEGRDLLTLITCHPYGDNTHRYVVYLERAATV